MIHVESVERTRTTARGIGVVTGMEYSYCFILFQNCFVNTCAREIPELHPRCIPDCPVAELTDETRSTASSFAEGPGPSRKDDSSGVRPSTGTVPVKSTGRNYRTRRPLQYRYRYEND